MCVESQNECGCCADVHFGALLKDVYKRQDENGRCVDIVKRDRGTSECMIEEFMLLANQCAANAGRTNKVPFVYRVHEAPDAEKMEKLSATLLACGLNAKFKNPIPTQLELGVRPGKLVCPGLHQLL